MSSIPPHSLWTGSFCCLQGGLASAQGSGIVSMIPLMNRRGMPPGWSAGESSDSGADSSGQGNGNRSTALAKDACGTPTSPAHALLSNARLRLYGC